MHPLLSAALQEAYAACLTSAEAVDTLELGYSGSQSIYLCKGFIDRTLLLEYGNEVIFRAMPFSFNLPTQDDSGARTFSVTVENVNGEVISFIENAQAANKPVTIKARTYLVGDTPTPPQNPRPIIVSVQFSAVNVKGVTLTASVADVVNRSFPNSFYSFAAFPGLRG